MFASALIQRIRKSEFARHVGTLATGSLLAQFIALAASPFLTRLYGPESFAVLALFMAIVATIAPVASGRYDVAIVVARDEKDSDGLLALSLWVVGAISLLMLLILALGQQSLKEFLNAESLGFWWLLAPLIMCLTAAITALRYFANRHKRYVLISRVLVVQALCGATLSISLGVAGFQGEGLLISALLTTILGTALLLYSYRSELGSLQWRPSQMTWNLAKRYKQFPLYEASTTFLNSVQLALPVFFLAKYFPEAILGYYALLMRVALSPLGFISSAVSQVYLRKVAELVQRKKDSTRYLIQLSLTLATIVAIPTFIFMLYAPTLFGWVFGEQWREAGFLLTILMPGLAVRFVASSVSGAIPSTGNSRLGAYWKIFAFITTFSMFWLLAGKLTIEDLFFAMMLTDVAIYSLYLYVSWYSVKHPREFD